MTSLMGLLADNTHVRGFSVANIAGCEVGAAYMPWAHLMRMPFDAFAISGAHPDYQALSAVNGFRRFDFIPRPSGVSSLYALRTDSVAPSLLCVEPNLSEPAQINHTQTATIAALHVADAHRFSSVAFVNPFVIDDGAVLDPQQQIAAMVIGIATYLLFNGSKSFDRVLIGVDRPQDIQAFDEVARRVRGTTREELRAAHERRMGEAEGVSFDAYLRGKMRSDPSMPGLIKPYHAFSPARPLIMRSDLMDPSIPVDIADLNKPSPGFVRFVSNQVLDRAMQLIPEYIRTVRSAGQIDPFYFSRVALASARSRQDYIRYTLFRGITATVPSEEDSVDITAGEIALFDLPLESADHPDKLAHYTLEMCVPQLVVRHLRRLGMGLPEEIERRISANLGKAERLSFNSAEFERYLIYGILHECAEFLWHSLPSAIQATWMNIYPLSVDRRGDRIFYRNLIRVNDERKADIDPAWFFGRETFADKMALYWHDQPPTVLNDDETLPDQRIKLFLDRTMALARVLRERYGTALLTFR